MVTYTLMADVQCHGGGDMMKALIMRVSESANKAPTILEWSGVAMKS